MMNWNCYRYIVLGAWKTGKRNTHLQTCSKFWLSKGVHFVNNCSMKSRGKNGQWSPYDQLQQIQYEILMQEWTIIARWSPSYELVLLCLGPLWFIFKPTVPLQAIAKLIFHTNHTRETSKFCMRASLFLGTVNCSWVKDRLTYLILEKPRRHIGKWKNIRTPGCTTFFVQF